MTSDVLKEIQDFFAFLTGIFNAIAEMFKGLFGGAEEGGSEAATEGESAAQ